MRNAASPIRLAWVAVFALLLSLRLLGSTGYMLAIDDGRLTIVACPDADANAPFALGAMHHHHGHANHNHNICPYAAAGAMGALGADFPPLVAALNTSLSNCQSGLCFTIAHAVGCESERHNNAAGRTRHWAAQVCHGDRVAARAMVMQQKTQGPVQFEITS